MIPEIGHFALILALLLAIVGSIVPLVGAHYRIDSWMRLATSVARAQCGFVAVAFGALAWSFVSNDFSVLYVAENSNSTLPAIYRFTAVWGGHEGSLLLWTQWLTLWMVAVTFFGRQLPREIVARVLAVMSWIAAGFLLFMLFTSNPFVRLLPPMLDGRGLNPLLQDPGMVSHPPVLYMGYVGFSVAFAFAIAALLSGRLDAAWARWSRPWTTAAWIFLTLGIMLGSGWAYYELGWGGWWFWDPVENASFMPWLAGTALIHSLAVTEKRGGFRRWTALLAICTFALSLLGTFLVRSGVVTSVHAFAADPARGVFILGFLALLVGGVLLLYAWRAPHIAPGPGFEPVSREALLLTNNVLLIVAAGSVLLGTLYPMALEALQLDRISVGPPYFDSVFVPLMTPAIFLMGVAPFARWKNASIPDLAVRLRWAALVSAITAAIVPWLLGSWRPLIGLGIVLAAWSIASVVQSIVERVRGQSGPLLARCARIPRATWGMWLAHMGVGVFIAGVTLVNGYEAERDLLMHRGERVALGAYRFRLDGTEPVRGPNWQGTRATITVTRGDTRIATLHPEKRVFNVQAAPMTEAAIDHGVLRDLYVALDQPANDGAWTLRIQIKPFVRWIWAGCAIMALGGALAASDRRYRLVRTRVRETARAAPTTSLAETPSQSPSEAGR